MNNPTIMYYPRAMALLACMLGLAGTGLGLPASAGTFTVTPVRIYMTPKDRAAAITITNESDNELVMQADLYEWKQKTGGEDELTLTENMFLSPPIIKLAPKSRQVVRLAALRQPQEGRQLTYRMIVREVPEASPPKEDLQLQIALAFSMPVFITPPGAKAKLNCNVEKGGGGKLVAVCENRGTAYSHPTTLSLVSMAGEKLASEDSGGYILPDIKRSFPLNSAFTASPAGKAKLIVSLDDGSNAEYEVNLAE